MAEGYLPLSQRLMTESLLPPQQAGGYLTARALLGNENVMGDALMGRPDQAPGPVTPSVSTDQSFPLWASYLPNPSTGDKIGLAMGLIGGPSLRMPGIRAFHGSPHKFDKFDISRIGTGEGAQAYGHGLYFAENEGVARDYQRRLSEMAWTLKNPTPENSQMVQAIQREAPNQSPSEAAQFLRDKWRQYWNYSQEGGQTPEKAQVYQNAARRYSDMADWIIDNQSNLSKGHMYEVNIRANPGDFLDWEAPVGNQAVRGPATEAIQGVRDVFARKNAEADRLGLLMSPQDRTVRGLSRPVEEMTGFNVQDILTKAYGPERATQTMRDAGIPGIKYLDQGSRTGGQGTSNYVVFDDNLIDILKRYGIVGGLTPLVAASQGDWSYAQ